MLANLGPVRLRRLIEQSVLIDVPADDAECSIAGIDPTQQSEVLHLVPALRTQAAVLMPLVMHDDGLSLLFTQRPTHMRRHPGQISFPGGRIEPGDAGPLAAALRETQEEIGLSAEYIQPIGYLPPLLIFTGYRVTPVVAFVRPGFVLRLDEGEVAEAFEVPFAHFMNPTNHLARDRVVGNLTVRVYDLPYGERRIWGATAGIIMTLYQRLNRLIEPAPH